MCKYSKLNLQINDDDDDDDEYFCAQLLHSSMLVHSQLTVTFMQQLSAKVFKLSFEHLHIIAHKVAIFAEKNS